MINFDLEEFKKFKEEAAKAGYESDNPDYVKKESDGSTTLSYQSGDWKFHDNFFGGEPYGGRTVYFYKDKPVHLTVYYGLLAETEDPNSLYKFLRTALKDENKLEFRGPKELSEGELRYTNQLKGDIDNFSLVEKIFRGNKEIYSADFIGGLVDQRAGD